MTPAKRCEEGEAVQKARAGRAASTRKGGAWGGRKPAERGGISAAGQRLQASSAV